MNLKKYIILLLFGIGSITAKSQDIIEYGIISSSDFPDTLYHYSVTNFTAYDLMNYIALKKRDVFTKLLYRFLDSSITAYKTPKLSDKYTYNTLKKALMTVADTTHFYDSASNTTTQYINYPNLVCFARTLLLDLPKTIGFETYGNNFMYVSYADAQRYLSDEDIALLRFLQYKKQSVLNDSIILQFAKKEAKALTVRVYNTGVDGHARPLSTYYDTKVLTQGEIATRVNTYWYENNPDSLDERGNILKRKIEIPFTTDSLKYIRLISKWNSFKKFDYNLVLEFIAPTFSPIVAGLELPCTPIFTLNINEAMSAFAKEETAFYSYCFRFNLSNRLSFFDEEMGEYSREYPPEGYEAEY